MREPRRSVYLTRTARALSSSVSSSVACLHASSKSLRITPMSSVSLLRRYLSPYWPLATVVAVLLGARIALQLAAPQALRLYVDTALTRAPVEALVPAVVFYGVAAFAQQLVGVASVYTTEFLGWTATNALRFDLTLHCLKLDLPFHYGRTPGVLIERVDGDVKRLAGFFSQFVIDVAGSLIMLAGILVILWIEDWRFGAAFGLATTLGAALYARVIQIPPRYWAQERAATAAFLGFVEERLAGAEDIRANGAVPYVMRTLAPHLKNLLERSRRAWVTSLVLNVSWQSYRAMGFAAAFGVGWWLHTRENLGLGTVYLTVWYFGLAIWPVMALTDRFEDLQKASASIGRIRDLLRERSALPEPAVARALPVGPLSVELNEVAFAYGSAPTLSDITFTLPAGRTLGLLGRTGSGKSTLSRLLFRFYDPAAGVIRIGGVDLRDLALAELRSRVALVTQEVQLFRATVRDNLTFFTPGVADERILGTLRELGLDPWLERLPHGLDTVLTPSGASDSDEQPSTRAAGAQGVRGRGGQGGGLSAGEAQLLAFARVFLRDPGLVVLDEASSRLDPATEALIDRAVARLLEERTAIVIAHRLATVRRVDDVLILDNGRIAEYGERAALERDPSSHFSRLLSAAGLRSEVLV